MGKKKRTKNSTFRAVPLPKDTSDAEDGDELLEDQDISDMIHGRAGGMKFLEELPKHELDQEASQPRKREKNAKGDVNARAKKQNTQVPEDQDSDEIQEGIGHAIKKSTSKNDTKKRNSLPEDQSLRSKSNASVSGMQDSSSRKMKKRKSSGDSSEEEGEAWERGPRMPSLDQDLNKGKPKKKRTALPIKTLSGEILQDEHFHESTDKALNAQYQASSSVLRNISGITVEDDLGSYIERKKEVEKETVGEVENLTPEAQKDSLDEKQLLKEAVGPNEIVEGMLGSLDSYISTESRREEARSMIASACQALLADPERAIGKQMQALLSLLRDPDAVIARLTMVSLMAVFRDIIPGYRILPLEKKMQEGVEVSKDVKKLWEFESILLKGYRTYLQTLFEASKAFRSGSASSTYGRVTYRCIANLLQSNPHFNFSSDLLQVVVPAMASGDVVIRRYCCDAIENLVKTGLGTKESGQTSVEAVQLIADLVRRRKCAAPPEVVSCLLSLEFPEITSGEDFKAARDTKKKKKKGKKGKRDEVDRAFEEAAAVTDLATRRHQQSSVLEALFEIFFRVIKTISMSGLIKGVTDGPPMPMGRFQKKFPLFSPTMIGLAKFSHLISIDYFQDLMSAMEELVGSAALPPSSRLLCLRSVSLILKGQGESLNVDRRKFYGYLYESIRKVFLDPLEEVNELDEETEDEQLAPSNGNGKCRSASHAMSVDGGKGSISSSKGDMPLAYLQAEVLESLILESKHLDAPRQAAFLKRLAGLALVTSDSGMSMGSLAMVYRLLRRSPRLRGLLENEEGGYSSGIQTYKPDNTDPAEAGALSVPLWELSIIALHYHPHVSLAAQEIAHMNDKSAAMAIAASGNDAKTVFDQSVLTKSVLPLNASPRAVASLYNVQNGGFRPAPRRPELRPSSKRHPNKKTRKAAPQGVKFSDCSKEAENEFLATIQALSLNNSSTKLDRTQESVVQMSYQPPAVNEFLEDEHNIKVLEDHYAEAKLFQKNLRLRNELALKAAQLKLFKEHLAMSTQKAS